MVFSAKKNDLRLTVDRHSANIFEQKSLQNMMERFGHVFVVICVHRRQFSIFLLIRNIRGFAAHIYGLGKERTEKKGYRVSFRLFLARA